MEIDRYSVKLGTMTCVPTMLVVVFMQLFTTF